MTADAAPWAGKRYSYAGWVPNVHSHLSFSLIGTGRGPEVSALSRRYKSSLRRFACAIQRRETDDFLAPMWYTRRFRPTAIQNFLLIGSTVLVKTPIGVIDLPPEAPPPPKPSPPWRDLRIVFERKNAPNGARKRSGVETAIDEQGMLRGRVFVLPRQRIKERRKRQDAWLKRFCEDLRCNKDREDGELDGLLAKVATEIATECHLAVSLEFALFRTGEVRIWFEDTIAARLSDEQRKYISRQAYFFVKDMVHHHVHHDPKSDQITPLTEIGNADPTHAEELWRRETVWSLSRAVDALARRGKLQDLREAAGILAYADAFQKSLLLYRRKSDDPTAFEPNAVTYRYDFAHIRESLKVQLDQVVSRRTTLSQMLIAGLAGCLAATSLLASTISAYNGAAEKKLSLHAISLPFSQDLIQFAANIFFVPAVTVGTILWLVSELFLSEDRIGVKRAERRKLAQGMRGLVNSAAVRLGWTGWHVQRALELFYFVLFLALVACTYYGTPRVIGFAHYVDRLQISLTETKPSPAVSPAATPSAQPSAPPRTRPSPALPINRPSGTAGQ